jgi:hypothetical protein
VTKQIADAGRILDIPLVDHLIILSKDLDNTIYAKGWIIPSGRRRRRFGRAKLPRRMA